jgi:hypothetical protein
LMQSKRLTKGRKGRKGRKGNRVAKTSHAEPLPNTGTAAAEIPAAVTPVSNRWIFIQARTGV